MCKQTRAHTYEEKDSRTLGRNEEIKVWPLSAALISSCRLYLLNLLFLALVPSPDGVQPRANPLAPRPAQHRHTTFNCPLFCFSYAHALCFFFLAPVQQDRKLDPTEPSDRGSIRAE